MKILNTALELFAENGFAGTSIRKITQEVGIKESSLYNHYSGKDKIIRDIYGRLRSRIFANQFSEEEIDTMLDTTATEDFFRMVLERALPEMTEVEMMHMWKIIIMEQFRDSRAGELLHNEITGKLTGDVLRVLNRMKEMGMVKSEIDLSTAAVSFIEGLKGLYDQYLLAEKNPQKQNVVLELMKNHVDFFRQAIKTGK